MRKPSWLDRLLGRLLRPEGGPSPEAVAAVEAAQRSRREAELALAAQRAKLPEAQQEQARLREHNDANHFIDWLVQQNLRGNQ